MPRATCSSSGCRCVPVENGLCGYHSVKAQWGLAWANVAHPNHPEARTKPGKQCELGI